MVEFFIIGGLGLSLILSLVRLFIGPTPQDRVLALDVITVQVSAFLIYWSFMEGVNYYIDIVLVIASAVFLSTILFARYLEKGLK
ncbi:hypothetical protein EW093_04080 [Thiospirochaeta perfilievii]|uniref:Cation:proton antiporter n=1 Tax=Thiospirochaeta perfilievii TaxID=252967 RepID=A0A5C1QAF9_9SPIO|nr:monovalent cation/H+ antiporter complex subunit F [Thiospirochaeta perfilievii]QEN03909.1 hypothetical protein EW093_04080 [Thiospirochaeta perfilievii]